MTVTTPSDDQVLAAVNAIRQEKPNLGRSKIRSLLKEEHQWQVSEDRLKRLIPAVNRPTTLPATVRATTSLPILANTNADVSETTRNSRKKGGLRARNAALQDVMRPVEFWLNQAHKNADARSLANELGLIFPNGDPYGFKAGLVYPIRRLVITGRDTPENFRILFGQDAIPDVHAQTRKEVLMSFYVEDGSPSQMLNSFLDEGCPCWAPRPANAIEQEEILRQREKSREFAAIMQSVGL
ncbi:uncharacterized protein BCR38DRAFT_433388 [Pseudomassariella vexata]|uniref:Uncharacterized protein n=1 Tax=Pseudomassariella vexata TaxID=1141098 RepID=A0A1Y2DZ29_9PEZI|nr:uncharacterized protein BCR38DRAFT_433388 [Pseudomassariella vexata]ORY63895.1 hypothetical protein BCR38DRAFT_433388 [Pseudomassariella vexata]